MPLAIVLSKQPNGPTGRLSRWALAWSIASVVLSFIIYLWIYNAGRGFAMLFRGFGGGLPWLTGIVLATYKFYGLLLLVGLIPCAILVRGRDAFGTKRARLIKLIVFGFGLAATLLVVFATAVYLPVFQMGSPVQ